LENTQKHQLIVYASRYNISISRKTERERERERESEKVEKGVFSHPPSRNSANKTGRAQKGDQRGLNDRV